MRKLILIAALAVSAFAQIVGGGSTTATVSSAGTPVVLTANDVQVKSFAVQLKTGTTATICVGGSNVSASSRIGTCVTGNTSNVFFAPANGLVYNLHSFYVDASSSSTDVAITYVQ